ncbi:hypothetical protein TWF506_007746 [Arthrobotrys conoides]|uniref:Uncharacterized protein n=1 Tax=Arthrobotrys conoides TaxID=74498 RepID=A0AAN8NG48_9PEZI
MCLILDPRRRMLLPLAVVLFSKSVNLVVGQDVEQLFYMTVEPVLLEGLNLPPPPLLNEFDKGGRIVYVKENILQGQEVGVVDLGWTPSASPNPQTTEVIQEETIQGTKGLLSNEKLQKTGAKWAMQLDYYALSKFRDPERKDDPSSFLLRFTNGHKFMWMPWTGLWSTWMVGSDKAMAGMDDLEEPVFVQKDGHIRIKGAETWDNFACKFPLTDDAGAETQSESQGGPPPPVWWQFNSLQRTVWKSMKVDRLSSGVIDCIPIVISIQEVGAPQTNGITSQADILQQDVIHIDEDDGISGQTDLLSAGDFDPQNPFQIYIDEDTDQAFSGAAPGGQSNFYSHGGTNQPEPEFKTGVGGDTRSEESEEYYAYDPFQNGELSPKPSEQADNSQSGDIRQPLEFPESPANSGPLIRANSFAALELGQQDWRQSFPGFAGRYHSTGELEKTPNGELLKALVSKSEEILEKVPG